MGFQPLQHDDLVASETKKDAEVYEYFLVNDAYEVDEEQDIHEYFVSMLS